MSFLSRFRVLTKILGIVCFLSIIAGVIAARGTTSLRSLSDATEAMDTASKAALFATRMNVNVVKINGAEFRVAADPRPETLKEVGDLIATEKKLFSDRFALVQKSLGQSDQQRVRELEGLWTAYLRGLEDTFQKANAIRSFQASDEVQKLHDSAVNSFQAAEKLRLKVLDLASDLDKRVQQLARDATANMSAPRHS